MKLDAAWLGSGPEGNEEIARGLFISPGTVRKHLENIYTKLEVGSRTAALAATGRSRAESEIPRA